MATEPGENDEVGTAEAAEVVSAVHEAAPSSTEADASEAAAAVGDLESSGAVDASGVAEAWAKVTARFEETLKQTKKPAGASQFRSRGKLFVDWCVKEGFSPEYVVEHEKDVLFTYGAHVDLVSSARIVRGISKHSAVALIEEAKNMAKAPKQPENEESEDEVVEGFEGDDEGDEGDEPEEEQAPPQKRRRAVAAVQPQVVYVERPAPRGRPPGRLDSQPRAGRGTFAKSVLQHSPRLRIYKRKLGGSRTFLQDIDVADVGGPIPPFIAEAIHPDHWEGDVTTYLVFELDSAGNERGQPVRIDLDAPEGAMNEQPQDQFTAAKRAMELMNEFRSMQAEQQPQQSEVLQEAKKKAAGSADMNSLMMLMMMERMMGSGGKDESVLLRVMEQMKPQTAALAPPVFPPHMMVPPAPPPQDDTLKIILLKMLEKTFETKPSQPDPMQMMMMMKTLGLTNEAPSALDQKLAMMEAKFSALAAGSGGGGGLDGYVNMFTKMREMVTTLAPQMNAGGFLGTVQSFLTPELTKTAGNFVAQVLSSTQQQLGQKNGQPAPAALPANAQPVPPSPTIKTNPMVDNAAHALRGAQGANEATLIGHSVELLIACYDDDRFKNNIDAVAQQLMMGNPAPAKQFMTGLLQQIRPDLANDGFVTKVLGEVMTRFNAQNAPASAPAATPLPPTVQVGGAAATANATPTPAAAPTPPVESVTPYTPPVDPSQLKPADSSVNEQGFAAGAQQQVQVTTAAVNTPDATSALA